MQETKAFTVHTNILYSIIQSQAGTLAKALLEGVMNSIDAGATRVGVHLSPTMAGLRDNGRGFQSRQEVLEWFGQFGTPHTEGDAVYGKFRMGRGQLMAFAVNTWRTGTFRMEVDVRNRGLDYVLTDGLRAVKGCRIDAKLYRELTPQELSDVVAEFLALVRYAQIPVSLNGRVISKLPATQSWDCETDDAYIRTDKSTELQVYNLGVLVRSYPSYFFGTGGVIVSKQQLMVNFARNDVLTSECPVWRRISNSLRAANLVKVAYKPSLAEADRKFLAHQWASGGASRILGDHLASVKLLTDAAGRHLSLQDLRDHPSVCIVSEKQKRIGAKLQREGKVLALTETCLERFQVHSLDELFDVLDISADWAQRPRAIKFEQLALDQSEEYAAIDDAELPVPEQRMLRALRETHAEFHAWFSAQERSTGPRTLNAGQSNVALAWTDGSTQVVLGKKLLKDAVKSGVAGVLKLLTVLTHEYCHDQADLESHDHDVVFYARFHDSVLYGAEGLQRLAEITYMAYQLNLAAAKPRVSNCSVEN